MGLLEGDLTGITTAKVNVYSRTNRIFSKTITVSGKPYFAHFLPGPAQHEISERTLDAFVNALVNDPQFVHALLESGQTTAMSHLN